MYKKILRYILLYISYIPKWYQVLFFQRCLFYANVGYWPCIDNPSHIREVILRNRVYPEQIFKDYIDKYKAKSIIDKINVDYNLNIKYAKTISVYDDYQNVDLSNIQEPCYIKASHGCGMNILYDPETSNKVFVMRKLKKWMKRDYCNYYGEKNYIGVEKNVLLENMLTTKEDPIPIDIKVHCFNGTPVIVQFIGGEHGNKNRKTYDAEWVENNWFEDVGAGLDVNLDDVPKDEVIKNAKILSKGFAYVRIDFFLINHEIFFSEFTFTPFASYIPLSNIGLDKQLYKVFRELENV